jgi:hypothetical protein
MPDPIGIEFEFDSQKAASNRRRHGVEFALAASAFSDPLSIVIPDPDHSVDEERFLLVGHTLDGRLVVVAFTERGLRFRLISARLATRHERKTYEERL